MTTVSVSASDKNPTHHASLSDGSTTYGLILPGGVKGVQEFPYQPSSLQFNQGRSGYSSFELPYSSIIQSDWTGGRGQLKFEDETKFLDSYNAWTVTPGIVSPAPQAQFWKGARSDNGYMPPENIGWSEDAAASVSRDGEYSWTSVLTGSTLYHGVQFTSGSAYAATHVWAILRFFGSPGNLTIQLRNDDGSDKPGSTVHANYTAIGRDNQDEPWGVGQLRQVDFGTPYSLTDATKYWIVIKQTSGTHDSTNYWQIAGGAEDADNLNWAYSADDSTWNANPSGTSPMYFRVTDADIPAEHFFLNFKRGLYAFSRPLNGSTGKIFFNGDRGVATGTQSSTTLDDTTKSWTTDQWRNQYLHIWNGTGEGQYRKITTNDSNTLTVGAWDVTPAAGSAGTGSEYLIQGTDRWQNVTPSGSGAKVTEGPIVGQPITLWGIIYLPQGQNYNILRLREFNDSATYKTFWGSNAASGNYGTNVSDNDGTNKADFMAVAYDPVNENIIWRGENNANPEWSGPNQTSVSRADDITWSGTDLSFGSVIPIGIPDTLITNLVIYNGKLWVMKEDSVWYVDNDGSYDRAYPIQVGLEAMISPFNGKATAVQDLYLYFNWSHSIERFYAGTMDDMGPWKGTGMLDRAKGYVHSIIPAIGWLFASVNGGSESRQSSILMWNGAGWHCIFRGQQGKQITNLYWQSVYGDNDAHHRLWFSYHGDIMYIPFPQNALNIIPEDEIYDTISSYVVLSEMDAGYAELEKYIKQVNVAHGSRGSRIDIDYAMDDTNPAEPTFTAGGAGSGAASSTISLAQSRKKRAFIRVRMHTENADERDAFVKAVVVDAVARMPVKYNWKIPVRLKDKSKNLIGELDHDPDTLYSQLKTWSSQAQALTLRSVLPGMDSTTVFIEPPTLLRDFWNRLQSWWGGSATFTLREV